MKHPILNVRISGQGPVVVLLHGFLSSSEYWQKVSDISEADHTVVAIDLLGFGASPKPRSSRYDYEAHIGSIDATLDHLGITQDFTLVGHSMGSLIALRYTRAHPYRVSRLVLVNLPLMLGRSQVRAEIGSTSFAYRYGLRPYTHRVVWALFKTLFRLRLLSSETVRRLEQNEYFFEHSPLSRIRSYQHVIAEARADVDLNLIRVETLILSGSEDRQVYTENLSRNVSLSPTVELKVLPAGHHIPHVMPHSVAEVL